MRVIFLDVDGVLNHQKAFEDQKGQGVYVLCPQAVSRFKHLVAVTGAQVVLSSTWRKSEKLVNYLRRHGVLEHQHEHGKTPDYVHVADPIQVRSPREAGEIMDVVGTWHYGRRGDEIAFWLRRHPEVTQYIILDDDGDMLDHQKPFFIQTDFRAGGLTDEKLKESLNLFGMMGPDK